MNPMRATIAIMMALLIQPVFPQEATENVFITELMKRAEQGFADAQFNLGLRYAPEKGCQRT